MIDLIEIAYKLPVKFYSNNIPREIEWPYILVHTNNFNELYERNFTHAIIDIHVHRFRKHGDYPLNELINYVKLVEKLAKEFKDRITFVMPDLPYDVNYFHGVQYPYNIRKTYTYHTMFIPIARKLYRKYGTTCMLVVQHRQKFYDLEHSCEIVNDMLSYVDDNMVYAIGVGSLCVNRSPYIIADFINTVMRKLKLKIHGFGIHLKAIEHISEYERFSFDSTSWTRPVNDNVRKIVKALKRYSCKTEKQRVVYFLCYVARLCAILNYNTVAGELIDLAIKYYNNNNVNVKVKFYGKYEKNILNYFNS